QAIRRGAFVSVDDLVGAVDLFIGGWNGRCEPFKWTKTADEILSRTKMAQKTSATDQLASRGARG
ncbi:MAG: hypothetical protein ACRDYX_17795, partial [Egibacteraceae bacterium]